jgi:RluA family pseudouridine synthase
MVAIQLVIGHIRQPDQIEAQPPFCTAHSTHRLDRDTSGVVLVAKNSEACAEIGVQFAAGQVKKEYVAIVHGQIDSTISEIRLPIGKATDSTISYKFWTNPEGKDAVTRIVGSEQIGNAYSLVYLQPITGRTHQIRVHLAATGYTIVGDKLYGMSEDAYKRWRENPSTSQITFQFYRHALHCRSLVFNHPFLKTVCRIEAAIPDDMINLQMLLKKEGK